MSAEYLIEVYVPSLVSRRAHFPSFPANDPLGYAGLLYVPGADLEAEMKRRGMLPRSAKVLTDHVQLGQSEPEGRSKVGDNWRDRINGVRIKFVAVTDHPPTKAEVRPWELKRVTPLEPEAA